MLVYRDGSFLVILEGEAKDVDQMLWMIGTDHRCARVNLVARNYLVERNFPGWLVSFPHAASATTRMPSFRAAGARLDLHGDSRSARTRTQAFRDGHLRCD